MNSPLAILPWMIPVLKFWLETFSGINCKGSMTLLEGEYLATSVVLMCSYFLFNISVNHLNCHLQGGI